MHPLKFSTNDVLAVTGWTMNTFQSHLRREDVIRAADVSTASRGVPRRYSWAAVMQFAVGAELISLGITPGTAFQRAAKVAFFGSRGGSGPDRVPGFPFAYRDGQSWLVIAGDEAAVMPVIGGKLELQTVPGIASGGLSFQAVDLTKIFERTCTRLEIDPAAMLRDIYPVK